jgi:hypothetical protein
MSTSQLDQALQHLRDLFAAEYRRGEKDAIARIMAAAQTAPVANGHDTSGREPPPEQKDRAPRGTAKALIDRVLKERGQRGATPSEIKDLAVTDTEKLASFAGIRFALKQGRDDQRYRNRRGKWFSATPRVSRDTELPKGDSR